MFHIFFNFAKKKSRARLSLDTFVVLTPKFTPNYGAPFFWWKKSEISRQRLISFFFNAELIVDPMSTGFLHFLESSTWLCSKSSFNPSTSYSYPIKVRHAIWKDDAVSRSQIRPQSDNCDIIETTRTQWLLWECARLQKRQSDLDRFRFECIFIPRISGDPWRAAAQVFALVRFFPSSRGDLRTMTVGRGGGEPLMLS